MEDSTRKLIDETIKGNDVVLFMKGNPAAPQCGFSSQVVGILDGLIPGYATVDVLADGAIREGIKEYSDWPTIPQLYIKGEFIGGCDIIKDMYADGQLEEALGLETSEVEPPEISMSASAIKAFSEALQSDKELVRLEIDPKFQTGLSIGPAKPKDITVKAGELTLHMDRASASRARGMSIDYVDGAQGPGFKIENPNEPPKVRPMTVKELRARLDETPDLALFAVRPPTERDIASIQEAKALDPDAQKTIMALPKETPIVFHCHHGGRSAQAAEFFVSHGFKMVYNLMGGIDAWSQEVDSNVPRY